jgi:L-threonylcarbamoyladenylate synthase
VTAAPAAQPALDAQALARIAAAAAALARGQVVAFPTETFYGLAVDALSEAALARLWALKQRPAEKVVALIVDGLAMAHTLASEVSPAAEGLIASHWPGPLTVALPAREGLPPALVADGCVALRQSSHPIAQALAQVLGRPITATSANRAGQPPAQTAAAVRASFPSGCLILDGGETPGGLPSTLVRVRGENVELLRRGPVVLPGVE